MDLLSQPLLPILNRLLDQVVEKMTPQEILAFQASEDEKEYVQELVERNLEGSLTPEEKVHLDQYVEFDLLVGVLKAKALKALK
jgi:hypothetical protein